MGPKFDVITVWEIIREMFAVKTANVSDSGYYDAT